MAHEYRHFECHETVRTKHSFSFSRPSPIDFDDIDEANGKCISGLVITMSPNICKMGSTKWASSSISTQYKSAPIGYLCSSIMIATSSSSLTALERKCPKAKLVHSIESQSKALGTALRTYENEIMHQWGNSECGIYCLYMISMLEKANTPKKFMGKRISDSFIATAQNFFTLP